MGDKQRKIITPYALWELLEDRMMVKIPTYLKNLLTLHGFDNIISLGGLTHETIEAIEEDSREKSFVAVLRSLAYNFSDYYGPIYKTSPQTFKISSGHKILLKAMAEHVQKEREKILKTEQEQQES